jgi:hypothetical protein
MLDMITKKKQRIREIDSQISELQNEKINLEWNLEEIEEFFKRIPEYDTNSKYFYVLRRYAGQDKDGNRIWEIVRTHHEKWVVTDYVNFMAEPGAVFEITKYNRLGEGSGILEGIRTIEC